MNSLKELMDILYAEELASVASTKNDSNLKTRFFQYMNCKYGQFVVKLKEHPEIEKQMLKDWKQSEMRIWGGLSDDAKYVQFTPDKALQEIDEYSCRICEIAKKKLCNAAITDSEINSVIEYVEQMKRNLSAVLTENDLKARRLISEGVVEANYICGKSNYISLRLGDFLRNAGKS